MSKREAAPEDIPEDEDMEFDDEDMDDGIDLLDALSQMFTTEDGETVASALVGLRAATEMQNKILIKILSALSKPTPMGILAPP